MSLEDYIQDIPDFPKPGIGFKDITPLFLDPEALRFAVDQLAEYARSREIDSGCSSRGPSRRYRSPPTSKFRKARG